MNEAPQFIWRLIRADGTHEWLSLEDPAEMDESVTSGVQIEKFRRTSHAWARRNPERTMWTDAFCGDQCSLHFDDLEWCVGSCPFDYCCAWSALKKRGCGNSPMPYRHA